MKLVLAALCITLVPVLNSQAQTTLRIRGSDTLGAKLVPSLAEAFKKQGGRISFDIAAEGSSTAFTNLASRAAEIGMSSRKIKPDERTLCRSKSIDLNEITIAWDMITVVVNKNNPITDLKKKHVMQIFAGDVRDWSELGAPPGPISVYTRNTSSGTYRDFMLMAMKGREYARHSQKMAGNEQIASEVAANPNGIGYISYAYVGSRGIKMVSIGGGFPNPAAVKSYVLSRPTFLYTDGEPTGSIKEFIDFCRSPVGDTIISRTGFVPLSQMQ